MSQPDTETPNPTAPDVDTPETPETPTPETPETPDTPAEAPDTETAPTSEEDGADVADEGETFDAPQGQHVFHAPSLEAQKKQQDKDREKLERENARHDARVREIMGEDQQYLVACPLCADGPIGFLLAQEGGLIGEEKLQTLRDLLGIGQPSPLKPHPSISTCETCGGEGECDTGSKRRGYERIDCPTCYAKGWFDAAEPRNQQPPANGAAEPSTVTGPTVYQADQQVETFEDDPAVVGLRERGFMVIPPMTINAG